MANTTNTREVTEKQKELAARIRKAQAELWALLQPTTDEVLEAVETMRDGWDADATFLAADVLDQRLFEQENPDDEA